MSALLRNILVLLAVMALLLVPVLGGPNGKGGLVNLPGGGALASHYSGGCGTPPVTRSSAQDLTLVLDPTMIGAVVGISMPGTPEATYSATENGRYVITAASMKKLIEAGVSAIELEFISPNMLWLNVLVTFTENQRVVVSFR